MSASCPAQMITIGKFISPFGVKGEIKVYPYSDFLERCALLNEVTVEGREQSEIRRVTEARVYKNLWVLRLKGCDTREDAALLTGSLLKIPSDQRLKLPEGSYYLDEIIGLAAISVDGEKLGVVREVIQTGANDIYVVDRRNRYNEDVSPVEILVPALRSVVKEINLQEGFMLLDLPAGLMD